MSALVRSGQSITVTFTTHNFSTGALANGDSTPSGTIYVNGTADAASVTVTNITTGRYKASVTLPSLAIGDQVDLFIAATVSSVAGGGIVWRGICAASLDSNGRVDVSKIAGTTQTARDLGASVLISSGTGTGQLSVTSGVIAANVTQFGGSAGTFASGRAEVNTTHVGGTSQTAGDICGRLTSTRAGYLDNLSGGAAALEATAQAVKGATDAFLTMVDQPGDDYVFTAAAVANVFAAGNVTTLLAANSAGPHLADTIGYCLDTASTAAEQLQTAMELDGSDYRFTANALEQAPSGGGGGPSAADIWAYATRTLTSSALVVLASPVSSQGAARVIQGDDYNATDGTALTWTCTGYPSFSGGSVTIAIENHGDATTFAGTVVSSTAVRLALTAAQTAALAVGRYRMQVQVTLSSGRKVTPIDSTMTVVDRV